MDRPSPWLLPVRSPSESDERLEHAVQVVLCHRRSGVADLEDSLIAIDQVWLGERWFTVVGMELPSAAPWISTLESLRDS